MEICVLIDLRAPMRIPGKKAITVSRILLSFLECQTLRMRIRNKYIKLTELGVAWFKVYYTRSRRKPLEMASVKKEVSERPVESGHGKHFRIDLINVILVSFA